jgi:hypothetical protein
MRGMNLPPLPAPPSALDECWKLYVHHVEHGVMPFPEASQLLVAYMAWPNDRRNRDRWMATIMAFFIAEQSVKPFVLPSGTTTEPGPRVPPPNYYSGFELFGGLRTVADASLSHMMRELNAIQPRWPRVADVLQTVVDIRQEKRASIPGGASISKALDLLQGHSVLPRKARLSKDWSDFRDVSHLIAASAAIAFAGREQTRESGASAVLTPLLLVPEVVLALGLAFQAQNEREVITALLHQDDFGGLRSKTDRTEVGGKRNDALETGVPSQARGSPLLSRPGQADRLEIADRFVPQGCG